MIDYAVSLARSQKSDESFSQSLLVLEQCHSTQAADDNSKGMVLLAMSTLLHERGNFAEAIEKLQSIQDLSFPSIAIRVAATEALGGLHLELDEDDTSSVLTNLCYNLIDTTKLEIGSGSGFEVLEALAKALKGLLELVRGNLQTAKDDLRVAQVDEACTGSNHPKVGVILTCIALMYSLKATVEGSSALLIQEGLSIKALELLRAPSLDGEGAEGKVYRREIIALARGGYAETLCVQQNRKAEGEKIRRWAEAV